MPDRYGGLLWGASLGALITGDGSRDPTDAASYVKPCVKRGKTDAADAEAICEAVTRPSMRFVPVKSEADSDIPRDALEQTLHQVCAMQRGEVRDQFGRDFTGKPALDPPYFAVKVTGALFHTQGGLLIDEEARVQDIEGYPFPNLFAGGGAAKKLGHRDVRENEVGIMSPLPSLPAVTRTPARKSRKLRHYSCYYQKSEIL